MRGRLFRAGSSLAKTSLTNAAFDRVKRPDFPRVVAACYLIKLWAKRIGALIHEISKQLSGVDLKGALRW